MTALLYFEDAQKVGIVLGKDPQWGVALVNNDVMTNLSVMPFKV